MVNPPGDVEKLNATIVEVAFVKDIESLLIKAIQPSKSISTYIGYEKLDLVNGMGFKSLCIKVDINKFSIEKILVNGGVIVGLLPLDILSNVNKEIKDLVLSE